MNYLSQTQMQQSIICITMMDSIYALFYLEQTSNFLKSFGMELPKTLRQDFRLVVHSTKCSAHTQELYISSQKLIVELYYHTNGSCALFSLYVNLFLFSSHSPFKRYYKHKWIKQHHLKGFWYLRIIFCKIVH